MMEVKNRISGRQGNMRCEKNTGPGWQDRGAQALPGLVGRAHGFGYYSRYNFERHLLRVWFPRAAITNCMA